jgi:nicotinamide-nucleotide amidase
VSELKDLMLREPRLTLAVAESLTGGRLQARITAITGASEFFLGGMTAYSLDQKVRHLGVGRGRAKAANSVSRRVAEQMAKGACGLFKSDVGVATTGYAEVSAEWKVRVPFAWWAVAVRKPRGGFAVTSACVKFPGLSRVEVQEAVSDAALGGLLRATAAARRP